MLTASGRPADRLTAAEFTACFDGAPVNNGNIDYAAFTRIVKRGKEE